MNVREWLTQAGTQAPDPANPEEWEAYQRAQWEAVSSGLVSPSLDLALPPSLLGTPTPIAASAPVTGMTSTTTALVGLPSTPSSDTRPSWFVSEVLTPLIDVVGGTAGRSWYSANEQAGMGAAIAESEPVQSAAVGLRDWILEETPAGAYYQFQAARTESWLEQPYQAPVLAASATGALEAVDDQGVVRSLDPWRAFQEKYDPNSQVAQTEAFGALFGGMGAYVDAWAGDRMEGFRRSDWAPSLANFGNKVGVLDDLMAISPIPGLDLSAVEALWGPVEAFQTVHAQRVGEFQAKWNQLPGYKERGFVPIDQTSEWFADVWGLAAAIPGDIGQTYRGFQAARDPRTYFEPGYLEQREAALGERGRELGGAWHTATTTNPWALPTTQWEKWGDVGSALLGYFDLDVGWGDAARPRTREETEFERNWRALAMSAYGVVNPDTGQSLGVTESYQMAANWLTERDAMVAQMRADAALAYQFAQSGVAPAGGQTPEELKYIAAYLEGEAVTLEQMNMADWVDENTSLLQRVGWNLALDWTEAVGKVNTLLGLAGGAPRAVQAAKGVLHLDEVRAVQNVVRGLAGDKVGWLGRTFGDETGAATVGGALFVFDPLARVFYPKRADTAANVAEGVLEVREVDLVAAINAPSMIVDPEDIVMSTLSRDESARRARAARGRISEGWLGESQLLGAADVDADDLPTSLLPVSERAQGALPSTVPAELRDLQLPDGVFDEAAWEGRDREALGRLSGYLKQNWAAFGSAGGPPMVEAEDIFRRIAETPGDWSQAGALMLDLERQIGGASGATEVVLDLSPELVANRAQLWETLSQLQGLAYSGGWMMTTPAREIVDTGKVTLQMAPAGANTASLVAVSNQFDRAFDQVQRQRLFYAAPEEMAQARAAVSGPIRWDPARQTWSISSHEAAGAWSQAADEVVMGAIKGEYADYRAALPRQAQNFEAASWLFEQFSRGSYDTAYALDLGFAKPGELPSFMASVTDIETARAADLLMEASGLGYYLDWEQMRVTPKGLQVPVQAGQATEMSVMRAAPTYLDELITRAGGTQHPSMIDIALRQYGPELLETLQGGDVGAYMAAQPGQNLRGAYQQMADAAQQAGLQVEVLDVDQGGFSYRLSPSSGAEAGTDAYAKWVAMFEQPGAAMARPSGASSTQYAQWPGVMHQGEFSYLPPSAGGSAGLPARLEQRPDVLRAYDERDLGWRTFGGGGRLSPDVSPYTPRLLPSGAAPASGVLVENVGGVEGSSTAHWMFDLFWPGASYGASASPMALPMAPASRNMLDPARSLPFSFQAGVDAPEAIWATAEHASRGNTQMLSALRTRIEEIGYQASLTDVRRVVEETVTETMPNAAAPVRQRLVSEYMGFVGHAFYPEAVKPYDELLGVTYKALQEADAGPANVTWREAKEVVGAAVNQYLAGAPAAIAGDLRLQARDFVREVLYPAYAAGQRPSVLGGARLPAVAPLLDVLDSASAASDEFVYAVLTPGTWKIDERGQLVAYPQSIKRWDANKKDVAWRGGFRFYGTPDAAMRGTPYEEILGSPEQAYARGVMEGPMGGGSGFTPAAHDEYELPAFDQLDELDQLDAERGLVNDEGTIVEKYRPYDNSPDVGGVDDLYPWVRERPQLPSMVRPQPPYPSLISPEELANYSPTEYYAESLRAYGAVTDRPDRPAAIARATADYPLIAIRRSELEKFVSAPSYRQGDATFGLTDLGAGGVSVDPSKPYAYLQLPQGSFVIGSDAPDALPGQMSSPTTGFGVFVGGLYERAINMVAGLPVDKLRALLDLQAQTFGDAARKVADTLDDAKLLEMAQQQPGFFAPKGVPVKPRRGDGYIEVPPAGVRSDALKQDVWKQFAWTTGAWHEPAEMSWKGEVPWYLRYYGGQYFPPTQQGYEQMLYDLLRPGYGASKVDLPGFSYTVPAEEGYWRAREGVLGADVSGPVTQRQFAAESTLVTSRSRWTHEGAKRATLPSELADVVPDVLRMNPQILSDYQLLVGAALGYDVSNWAIGSQIVMPPGSLTEGLPDIALLEERAARTGGSYLSAGELDPTYWQAMAKARGHTWAADLPEDLVSRMYGEWTAAQAKEWNNNPLLASQPNPYAPATGNVLTDDPERLLDKEIAGLSAHYQQLAGQNRDMADTFLGVTRSVAQRGGSYEDAQRLLYQMALGYKGTDQYVWKKRLADTFTREDFDQLQAMVNFQDDTGEWGLLYEAGAPGYRDAVFTAWDDTVGDLSDDLMTGVQRSPLEQPSDDYLQRLVLQAGPVRPAQDADAFLADFEKVVTAFGGSAKAPTDAIWDALSAGYPADMLMKMRPDEIEVVSESVVAAKHNDRMRRAWGEMGWLDNAKDVLRQVGDFFADESGELRLGGWFGAEYTGRPADAAHATRVYEMGLTPEDLGHGSWAEALARGEVELIESEMRRRLMPGDLSEAAAASRTRGMYSERYAHSEYGYAQTFLTHIDTKSGLVGAWSQEAVAQYLHGGRGYTWSRERGAIGSGQVGPYSIYDELAAAGGPVLAENVGEAAPFVFGVTIGRDGDWAFKTSADMEAFAAWLDTTAEAIPESFYGWYDPATGGLARHGGLELGAAVPPSWVEGMRSLGWTKDDLRSMSPDTIYDVLQNNRRRPSNLAPAASEVVDQQSQQGPVAQTEEIWFEVPADRYEQYREQWKAAYDELLASGVPNASAQAGELVRQRYPELFVQRSGPSGSQDDADALLVDALGQPQLATPSAAVVDPAYPASASVSDVEPAASSAAVVDPASSASVSVSDAEPEVPSVAMVDSASMAPASVSDVERVGDQVSVAPVFSSYLSSRTKDTRVTFSPETLKQMEEWNRDAYYWQSSNIVQEEYDFARTFLSDFTRVVQLQPGHRRFLPQSVIEQHEGQWGLFFMSSSSDMKRRESLASKYGGESFFAPFVYSEASADALEQSMGFSGYLLSDLLERNRWITRDPDAPYLGAPAVRFFQNVPLVDEPEVLSAVVVDPALMAPVSVSDVEPEVSSAAVVDPALMAPASVDDSIPEYMEYVFEGDIDELPSPPDGGGVVSLPSPVPASAALSVQPTQVEPFFDFGNPPVEIANTQYPVTGSDIYRDLTNFPNDPAPSEPDWLRFADDADAADAASGGGGEPGLAGGEFSGEIITADTDFMDAEWLTDQEQKTLAEFMEYMKKEHGIDPEAARRLWAERFSEETRRQKRIAPFTHWPPWESSDSVEVERWDAWARSQVKEPTAGYSTVGSGPMAVQSWNPDWDWANNPAYMEYVFEHGDQLDAWSSLAGGSAVVAPAAAGAPASVMSQAEQWLMTHLGVAAPAGGAAPPMSSVLAPTGVLSLSPAGGGAGGAAPPVGGAGGAAPPVGGAGGAAPLYVNPVFPQGPALIQGPLPAPVDYGRFGRYGKPWEDLNPLPSVRFAPSRSTRATVDVREMDLLGTAIGSIGANAEELAVILNAIAYDPTQLITGIDGSSLGRLSSQLDADNMLRLGPGVVGNLDMANAMSLMGYAQPELNRWALELANSSSQMSFDAFKERWGGIMQQAATQYYGSGIGDNPAWRALEQVGHTQRAVVAELSLSLSPGVWAANAIGANWANKVEGYGTWRTTEDLVQSLDAQVGGVVTGSGPGSSVGVTLPTERTQGAIEGKVVGSGAYLGLGSESLVFRPDRWGEQLIDLTMGWWASPELVKDAKDWWRPVVQKTVQPASAPKPQSLFDRFLSLFTVQPIGVTSSTAAPSVLNVPGVSSNVILAQGGVGGALDAHNPMAPLATVSELSSHVWTGNVSIAGGHFGVGEQANYVRSFAVGAEQARRFTYQQAFGPVWELGEQQFGAGDPVIRALREATGSKLQASNRRDIAEIADIVLNTMVQRSDPSYRDYKNFIARDLLGTYDEYSYAGFKAARAGADNVMLEPSLRSNFDEWLAPFFAFAYFGIHNAMNWAARSLRDPQTLRSYMLFERAAEIENENSDVPTRYEGTLPGPWGMRFGNVWDVLSGGAMRRFVPNDIGMTQASEAESTGDLVSGAVSAANLRFLPLWGALATGDASYAIQSTGWQLSAADLLLRSMGRRGLGIEDQTYDPYRAGRWIGGETLEGTYTPATGLMGQQYLYDRMWEQDGIAGPMTLSAVDEAIAAAGADLGQLAMSAVSSDALMRLMARVLLPMGVKQPVPEGEVIGARMGEHMRQVGPSPENPYGAWGNIDTWKARHPEWQVWAARGSLYPEQEQVPPTPSPADRLYDVVPDLPATPSVPPPTGWQPPEFDLGWGRRMDSAEESPYAESGDTTAIYALVDPRTRLVRYIGQSLHPSQRYVQHLEQFSEDGFDHPKTAWEAELYREGEYPQMYVFDWQPGTVDDKADAADKMEQLWIGFMRHEVGVGVEGWGFGDVNVSVPDRATWEALLAESGLTTEAMRQMVMELPRRGDPVQLERAPKIDWSARSPFPGEPLTPDEILLAAANPVPAKPAHWVQFAAWVDGLTLAHEQALYDAGVHTWTDLAQAVDDEELRVRLAYQLGVSFEKVAEWAGHAAYTVRVQAGEAPVPPLPPAEGESAGAAGAPPQPVYNPLSSGAPAAGAPVEEPGAVPLSSSVASLVALLSQMPVPPSDVQFRSGAELANLVAGVVGQAPAQSGIEFKSGAELAELAAAIGEPAGARAAPVQPVVLDASARRGAPAQPGYSPLSSVYASVADEDAGEAAYSFLAVYSPERIDAAMVALSQSHQLMRAYGDLPEGAPELLDRQRFKQSYGAMQGVMRYYSFTDEARRYLTDNVAPYVYDLEDRAGGGFFQSGTTPDTVMLYGIEQEAMVHEISHAWWENQRQQDRNGVQQSTAFTDEVKFLAKMQRTFEDFGDSYIEDSGVAKLITGYVYGDGAEFPGFYAGDQVNDHEIFAGLASGVMGDISRLPASLQPYYAGLFAGSESDSKVLASAVAASMVAPAVPLSGILVPVSAAPASDFSYMDNLSQAELAELAGIEGWPGSAALVTSSVPVPPTMAGSPFLESMSSSMLAQVAGIEGWPAGGERLRLPLSGGALTAASGGGLNAGNLVWGATSLLGLAKGWFQPSAGGVAGLFRLGQAAVAQTGDFFRGVHAYQEQVARAPGGGVMATGPGAAVSSKYWYLPGYRPSVKPGVGFALPTVPGGEFWLPANMTTVQDGNGSPQADWLNNPQFDPAHPEESMRRLIEVYGPLQPVPLEWLGRDPAYFGSGEHNIYDQPRVVARGRQGLQGSPYGVEGAGGMFRTIGAPDPRTQGDLAANWTEEAVKPRGEYGIWLETPFGGEAEVTQGFGENPDDYVQFGVAGHTGVDWSMKEGREITAAAPGQVAKVGFDEGGYGNYIVMSHDFGQTLYGHLSGVGVEVGQWLAVGDLLGLSGNTGRSTGAHLHFELILPDDDAAFGGRVDPTAYLPGGGTASSLGWMLADIPGISRRQVEALVDAGVLTPEQVAGEAPLPGMTQILSPEELAHWLDVNVFDAGGSDAVSARQGWNLIAGARAMLQTGPKPVKPKKGDGEGVVLGDGSTVGTPLRPGLVPGLTEAMIKTLNEAGITTFEQLAGRDSGMGPTVWMDALTGLPGIGPATAEKLVGGTLEVINSGKLARATEGGPPAAQPGDRPLEAGVVKGVGPATLDKLHAAGIMTVEQLRDTAPEWLALNVEGMGETTAVEVVDLATEIAKTPWDGRPNWEGLPYIGAVTEEEMYEKGYTASDALASVSPKRLAHDLSISEERARSAINAYRKANGLPQLTEEAEAALEALEGATPDDLEDIDGVGSKLEDRLYKGGYSTHASLYELGFDELKRVLAQPDSTTFKVLNALREEQGLPPFTSVAEARGATAAPVGEEPGNLGTAGVSSGQQQLLERQGVKTLKELTEISDADLAKWLGISVSDAQDMKRRAQQDMDARSASAAGDGAVPEPPLEMSDADPFAVRGPADVNMQRAFAALQKLRRGERPERDEAPAAPATVPQDTSMKPDARLNLGDALSTLLDGVERGQQAIRATMVAGVGEAAAGGSDATLATAAKGLGVNMDQLSEELLARLRLTLLKDVFDEFEKVMNS